METRTQLNGIRLAPRKVRAVANLLKRKDIQVAMDQLEHIVKKPTNMFTKLLKSAVSNAENNFRMVADNLYIKNIIVDEGIKLKRFMPRAQGRATEIQKKTSRVTVILDERVAGMKKTAQPKKVAESALLPEENTEKITKTAPKIERELGKKSGLIGNLKRRLFQRKSV